MAVSARCDTNFDQIYMDTPPGIPRLSKLQFFLQIKQLSACARIKPKLSKFRKTVKIENNLSEMPVYWQFFKFSAI